MYSIRHYVYILVISSTRRGRIVRAPGSWTAQSTWSMGNVEASSRTTPSTAARVRSESAAAPAGPRPDTSSLAALRGRSSRSATCGSGTVNVTVHTGARSPKDTETPLRGYRSME